MNRKMVILFAALAVFFLLHAQSAAQVYYDFTQSSGTYTPITGGTVLRSGTFDSGVPQTVALPTSFTFSGTAYSSCNVSIEGWLSFGGTNPGSGEVTPISSSSSADGFVAPFGADLANSSAIGSTPEIRWQQVGNEIIFQWQDVRRSGSAITERFSFQARLNTANGEIRLVYGPTAAIDAVNTNYPQVGLRGATNTVFLNRLVTTDWAASIAGTVNNATCQFSTTVAPASGLTYIWTPVPAGNVGVSSVSNVFADLLLPIGSSRNINAVVTNFTANAQSSIHVYYSVNGGPRVGPVNTTGSLAQNDTQTVSFTGGNAWTPSTPGPYTIKVFTDIVSEQVRSNDTITVTNVIVQSPIAAFPYYEKFTTAAGWTTSGTAQWDPVMATGPDGSGDTLARARFFTIAANNRMYYRSPLLNLPSAGGGAVLMHFHVAHRDNVSAADDTLQIVVSTDGGATWSAPLYDKRADGTPSLATIAPSGSEYTPSAASEWRHETVDLTPYAGQSNISVAFLGRSGFGNNAFVDNVSISAAPSFYSQIVSGASTVAANGISLTFSSGPYGGTLSSAKYTGRPSSTASPVFAANTTATAPDGSAFTPNVVTDFGWWTMTYSYDAITRTTYSVSIPTAGISGIVNASRLYIVKRADQSGSWTALTTTLAAGVLSATGLTGFSDFSIASGDPPNPLPIQLASFTGTVLGSTSVRLNWRTISETNNYGFNVERRAEGQTEYVEIPNSFIPGYGTTIEPHNYSFTDNTITGTGTYYYRLRQTDLDGTVNNSEPIRVAVGITGVQESAPKVFALLQNYPNPFNPSTEIKFSVESTAQTTLELYNLIGQKIATLFDDVAEAGQYYKVRLNAVSFASGVYFYRLNSGNKSELKKLLLLK